VTVSRALVTGATGFLGGHLCRALVADGVAVTALVRSPGDASRVPEAVAVRTIPTTAAELTEVVAELRPEAVFHLATLFRGQHVTADVEPLVAANVLFGTQLAEALARGGPPRVLVNVGTSWQADEHGAYRPAALYAATKQAMEDVLRFYAESGDLRIANVRLFDTYGPQDERGKLLSLLVRAGRDGDELSMSGGEQLIDLLHADDAVRALRRAADALDEPWAVWSASSGRPVSVRELVDLVGRVTGRPVPVRWGARPYRLREMFDLFDAGPAVPGWSPTIPLEQGLEATLCP
jgi:nucleoside-diphosphate-sugar epimerase